MNERIQATLNSLPTRPGIYLFKDEAGTLLYVGKATSLHQRVRSYFAESADLSPKNRSMVAKIADIEFIVVGSEVEALILECNYIKQYRPKYNVLMRDDKNYPYIKVSLTEDFPRIYRVRSFKQDGNRYFGPYPSAGAVDATLDLLNKLFAFRTCRYDASAWAPPRDQEPPPGWKPKYLPRPCTQYYIHRCGAPCVGKVSRQEYDGIIRQVLLFLEGKHEQVLDDLKQEMEAAAENLEFERAAALRDRVQAVEQVLEKQKIITTTSPGDQDVIALAGADDETCAQVFFFRGGKLVGREYYLLQGTRDTSASEVMASFLQQFYDAAQHVPHELILEHEPDDLEALHDWLRQKRGAAVAISVPRRGDKKRLVEMVAQNALEVLEQQRIKWLSDSQKTALALEEIQQALNLPAPPHRIECYDISNIQGTASVGAMVVFENGRPRNSDYRRFRIKTVEGANDYASHQEMLRRRFKRGQPKAGQAEEGEDVGLTELAEAAELAQEYRSDGLERPEAAAEAASGAASNAPPGALDSWAMMPDLVMIDGGKGHVTAALEVLQELGVDVSVVGVAKEDHSSTSQYEELWLPFAGEPLILPRGSQGLYLVQRIRDEAHRFAITYHRQVRSGKTFKSLLDEIPGIGPKRKKALLRRYGSARAISQASVDELAALEGMTRDAAERVKEFIGARHSAE
ncbi:MAG TPA: excinuclease ABC subunit UvrC [Ktedonobacterales bacterium]|nr:excinuclease ABC subunit UvrC [Ktedonobacterales bacterium]